MSGDMQERLSSLEHSRTAFKAVASVLTVLGVGLAGYATFLSSQLSKLTETLPQAITQVNNAKATAIKEIKSKQGETVSKAAQAAAAAANDTLSKSLVIGQYPIEVKNGAQYPGHGKLLVTAESSGRITLSGLFGLIPGLQSSPVFLAALPTEICPDEHQLFAVAVHPVGTARLDIYKNGEIYLTEINKVSREAWDQSTRGLSWLSLDGVSFFRAETCGR